MAIKFLSTKRSKIIAAAIIIPVSLVLILALVINRYWSPILAEKLRDAVIKGTDSLYRADFSDAQLHILQGKIMLYNVKLRPDTAVYKRMKENGLAPNNLVELDARRIIVSHIHPFTYLFKKKLDIGQIAINSPHIHLSYQLNHKVDTADKDSRTAWQKMSKSLKSAHVGDIFLDDISFKYDDFSGRRVAVSEIKQMSLHAHDLLIDSATQTDRSRFFYCKDVTTELNNYTGRTANGLYHYKLKKIKLSTSTSQVNMIGLSIDPVDASTFFSKSRQDKYTIRLDSVQLNNFDFLTYQKYRSLSATSFIIKGGVLDLYSNPNKLPDNKDKTESFPNVAIYQLQTDLKIDTVNIKRLDINYSELGKKSKKTGTLAFGNTRALFLNVTTNAAALKNNSIATAEIRSFFMNKGRLDLSFRFDLADKSASYNYKGHLASMKLEQLNRATMPLAMVKITSGTLNNYDFTISGNRKISRGHIALLYSDLKIKLLRRDEQDDMLKRKLIPTLFANIFILKHNNPDNTDEKPRVFDVVYPRPKNAPFFKTAWQTMLLGLKPSVGLDVKTEASVKQRMAKSAKKKKDKQDKKAKKKKSFFQKLL